MSRTSTPDDARKVSRTSRRSTAPPEPDYVTACQWWPDVAQYYTPLGWREHLFRFNVMFNGAILARPDMNRRTDAWKDQGVHLRFSPPALAGGMHSQFPDGLHRQGWDDRPTPLLWTRWAFQGVEFEQQVFANIQGGREVETGIEPLFAWIRLSVIDVLEGIDVRLPPHGRAGVSIILNAPYQWTSMSRGHNLMYDHHLSRYPRELQPDRSKYDAAAGWRLVESDERVRLGVAANADCIINTKPGAPIADDTQLQLWLVPERGAHADVLLPMVPTEREVFDAELAHGFDAALHEADERWAAEPDTVACVQVCEPQINEQIAVHRKMCRVIAEKNPSDGCYSTITSSWTYSNLWPTPGALYFTNVADLLGLHGLTARQLEIFHRYQGTVVPPGDAYKLHPGYFSSPKSLTSIDWLSDHGALLYSICNHALLTADEAFLNHWLERIVLACDFIYESRRLTGHGGVEGILPPAVATDRKTQIQGIWNDGWNYKGYVAAIRLLRNTGHPRAEVFAQDAIDYRTCWDAAFRAATNRMPTWTDARGLRHYLVPTTMSGDSADETRHAFYLDTGPLFLVYAGLLKATDPLMKSTRQWFREGPQWRQYRRESSCWQVPVLDHEMSSCEPCYSWVGYHSWQLGDRPRFLEAMYSLWAGAVARQTSSICETRGGIYAVVPALPQIHLARLTVIDEQIRPGELHLLRLVPAAWLQPGKQCAFENMPTEFGPVTLRFDLTRNGNTLRVEFKPDFRTKPSRIVLHVPQNRPIHAVRVNGKAIAVHGRSVRLD